MQFRKVLLMLLDSAGVGAMPDADQYDSAGAATIPHVLQTHPNLKIPNFRSLGLCSIEGLEPFYQGEQPEAVLRAAVPLPPAARTPSSDIGKSWASSQSGRF